MQLYAGMYYPLLVNTVGFSLMFSIYQLYRTARSKETYTVLDGIENGTIVGTVFTFLTTPVELIKCLMQNDKTKRFATSKQCLKYQLKQHGIRGIYKGTTIMFFRQVLGFQAQFACYELLKGLYVTPEKPHLTLSQSMIVGPLSMTLGWLFSYPQDVIKTKLQV